MHSAPHALTAAHSARSHAMHTAPEARTARSVHFNVIGVSC